MGGSAILTFLAGLENCRKNICERGSFGNLLHPVGANVPVLSLLGDSLKCNVFLVGVQPDSGRGPSAMTPDNTPPPHTSGYGLLDTVRDYF